MVIDSVNVPVGHDRVSIEADSLLPLHVDVKECKARVNLAIVCGLCKHLHFVRGLGVAFDPLLDLRESQLLLIDGFWTSEQVNKGLRNLLQVLYRVETLLLTDLQELRRTRVALAEHRDA